MTQSWEQMNVQRRSVLLLGLTGASALALGRHDRARAAEAANGPGDSMVAAARALLDSLSAELRNRISFPFDGADRFRWHYVPHEMFPRKGVPLKELTLAQRKAAHALLRTALSSQGYLKATHIMQLESILAALEGAMPAGRFRRDPELYWLMLFGSPSREKPWGWRVEGHHLSLNFSAVTSELVASTPAFMGSNPAEVREGTAAGLRVLGAEEDLARVLLGSLDDGQRRRAVIETKAPQDIITANNRDVALREPTGLPASAMTEPQRNMLWELVAEYVENVQHDIARRQLDKIRQAGIDKIHFAWAGSLDRGKPHYYRLHGPTSLIEYDNTQNNANHIHAVWRDLQDDFGGDLLRKHYEASEHHRND